MINKCIICGNRKLKSIIEINNAPAYAQRLLNKNEIKKDKKIPPSIAPPNLEKLGAILAMSALLLFIYCLYSSHSGNGHI